MEPATEGPERTLSGSEVKLGARAPIGLGGLDSAEIRLAGTAGPSGHLGRLDKPVQGARPCHDQVVFGRDGAKATPLTLGGTHVVAGVVNLL